MSDVIINHHCGRLAKIKDVTVYVNEQKRDKDNTVEVSEVIQKLRGPLAVCSVCGCLFVCMLRVVCCMLYVVLVFGGGSLID